MAKLISVAIAVVLTGADISAQVRRAGERFLAIRGGAKVVGNVYRVRWR